MKLRIDLFMAMVAVALPSASARGQDHTPTAIVVRIGVPGEQPEVADAVSEDLAASGYEVTTLDGDGLTSIDNLRRATLLVLPDASQLPAASVSPIQAYLQAGGDILAFNAPLWRELLIKPEEEWLSRADYEQKNATLPPEHVLFQFEPAEVASWGRGCFDPARPALYETVAAGPAPGQRALHCRLPKLENWDNFGPAALESAFPEGHTLTVFSARGADGTNNLSVEWQEKDGSRWIATVPLSREWRRYALAPSDFQFWESVPERARTTFNPANAARVQIGLSFTHTGTTSEPQEWWIGPFGSAALTPGLEALMLRPTISPMDTLAPTYKAFECTGVAAMKVGETQAIVSGAAIPLPSAGLIRAAHPRPDGDGFDKGRDWRWIPLIEAQAANGAWRGNPATLMIHSDGPFKNGQWASFGIEDPQWYLMPEVRNLVRQILERMRMPVYFVDGGSNYFTYFDDQSIEYGFTATNAGSEFLQQLIVRANVTDATQGQIVAEKTWPLTMGKSDTKRFVASWMPGGWPEGGYRVSMELLKDGRILDRVENAAHVWKPAESKAFITVEHGDFMLGGKRWRAHGVNYMPSSGIGIEDGNYFEKWLGARAYDTEIISRDLDHCVQLGINSVSIFLYRESMEAQNLLDILRLLRDRSMKANLSLRPGTPLDFEWDGVREMIEYYRLSENDTVYAYDLAWEPLWMAQKDRVRWDGDWAAWIVERYGSVENAESDWACAVPRDGQGVITNPAAEQLETDGDWRRMVAAYRRFLDTLLYKHYSRARSLVKSVDPHHLVSFRMTETGNPTMSWHGVLAYDFPYLAAAVDLLEPEGYGRIGDWEQVKPGWFQYEYARWAAPALPMIWAEAGVHAWDIGTMTSPQERLDYQGQYFRDFYRMITSSAADGIYWWWYPGGFRFGENSDYGIMNPDGTWRPNSHAIREHAETFMNGPDAKPVDHWIVFDRDQFANGMPGVYEAVQEEFWMAIDEGRTPGLRTEATGTDSATCPLVAVGNTPCNGSNPPKYLDGFFDILEVEGENGEWVVTEHGGRVEVDGTKPVKARLTAINLGEAAWAPAGGEGGVSITASSSGGQFLTALPGVKRHEQVRAESVTLTNAALADETEIVLSLAAEGRTPFGPRLKITLVP